MDKKNSKTKCIPSSNGLQTNDSLNINDCHKINDVDILKNYNQLNHNLFKKKENCLMDTEKAKTLSSKDLQSWTRAVCHESTFQCKQDVVVDKYCSAVTNNKKEKDQCLANHNIQNK